jgi:hypothetical protein
MAYRAGMSQLPLRDGKAFLGSEHFPKELMDIVSRWDPAGMVRRELGDTVDLAGDDVDIVAMIVSASDSELAPIRHFLARTIKGKKVLVMSGEVDTLVPYQVSVPFLRFLKRATDKERGLEVENRVFEDIGHDCSPEMVMEAVEWIIKEVSHSVDNI